MPQTQTTNQTDDYTAVDSQKDPIAFIYQHRTRLQNMDPDKAVKFLDMVFRRVVLPKYQSINKQRPLDKEEADKMRLQFSSRMLNIPFEPTELKGDKTSYGTGAKAAATVEGAGAGVLGGIKTIGELAERLSKHGGSLNPPMPGQKPLPPLISGLGKIAGKQEAKSFDDASLVSPSGASAGAAVGHQIPAMIATAGVEGAIPAVGKGAGILAKTAVGAGRGAAGGATYEATRPDGDPKQGAVWGGVLGAAFPLLGKMFGLGKRVAPSATPVGDAVADASKSMSSAPAASTAAEVAKPAENYKDIANIVAKNKFGKSFKDLTSSERAELPGAMREEIKKQAVQKQATAKATKAAAKAEKEVEETAKRTEKAKAATEKAAQQASKRSVTGATTPATKQAVAAKAAEENPGAAKILGGINPAGMEQGLKGRTSGELAQALRTENEELKSRLRAGVETPKVIEDRIAENEKMIKEYDEKAKAPEVKKVPEGQAGVKVRAKEGQPASPAQQAADRERIAKTRELNKTEEFGAALEKHAQELAGRHTSASLGIMHVPELEGAMKEMPEGEFMLKTLQKAKRSYKWSDEIYAESLKEWLLNQFSKEGN